MVHGYRRLAELCRQDHGVICGAHPHQLRRGGCRAHRNKASSFATRRAIVETYDHVVLASHADESLKLLSDADDEERATLRAFGYQRNRAVLHKDPQFMPKRKQCWASWVYHSDGNGDDSAITMSYWMNRLQNIDRTIRCS